MKLLYICGTYAPGAFAGSELSVHELLQDISTNHGIEVLVVTDFRYTGGKPGRGVYQGVPLHTVEHEHRHKGISEALAAFRPNVILTQLLWCDVAMAIGSAAGIPVILRLPGTGTNADLSLASALIANARSTCDRIHKRSGREVTYVPSAINVNRVVAPASDRNPRFIAMFNPITFKGGQVFHDIARHMPDREFAVVPGWHSLRAADGGWDRTVIRRSVESQRGDVSWAPEDVDFSDLANVRVLSPRQNVAEIFAHIRVLLVPSQWHETLGRVAIEGFANGIPVIASAVGGLQDHVRQAGILVKQKTSIPAWVEAIEALDDPACYELYSKKGRAYAQNKYTMQQASDSFMAVLERLCR